MNSQKRCVRVHIEENDARQSDPASREIAAQEKPPAAPETVAGAHELIAAGFEPIETLTGACWVVDHWPEEHRRFVPESRPEWLDSRPDGRLWFVRSPWDGLSAGQVLSVVWANLPRDEEPRWPRMTGDILRWTETQAHAAFGALPP
jgi:hypothetical protein